MMYNLIEIYKKASIVIKQAVEFIHKNINNVSSSDIEEKEVNSLVSYVDKEAENILVNGLGIIINGAGFITEEETVDEIGKEWTWIIDPLDGTTNYLYKIPHFCVSVALMYNENIVLGIVHDVMLNDVYHAIKGGGAYLNGEQLIIKEIELDKAIIATGFPYIKDDSIDVSLDIMKEMLIKSRGIRRLGSAALELCFVASGRLGAYYERTLKIWDLAAGYLILTEAGGKISDYDGEEDFIKTGEILASCPGIHGDILEVIKRHSKRLIE